MIIDAIAGAVGKIADWRKSKDEGKTKKAIKELNLRSELLAARERTNQAQVAANQAASAADAKFTFRDFAMWTAAIGWSLHIVSQALSWFMHAFKGVEDFPVMPLDDGLFHILSGGLGLGVLYRSWEKGKGVSRTCQKPIAAVKSLVQKLQGG